jgi:hypothetical protein
MKPPWSLVGLFTIALFSAHPTPATAQVTTDTALVARARVEGDTAAARISQFGWFGRGLAAGTIAGPLGTWWMVRRAGDSGVTVPDDRGTHLQSREPDVAQSYRDAFTRRLHEERKEYAFMGGVLGTGLFTFALLRFTKFTERASGSGDTPGGPGFMIHLAF